MEELEAIFCTFMYLKDAEQICDVPSCQLDYY